MKDIKIVDRYGNPIEKWGLGEEVATASLTGVRQVWMQHSIAGALSPSVLASLLQGANAGNDYDYLTLAEEMEEREWHYSSVIGTRKRAVEGLDLVVEAAGEDAGSEAIAGAVRQQVRRPEFEELISDLLDGIGKGRSTVEIMWRTGTLWEPDAFLWRDPRFFVWHPFNAHDLRLRDEADLYHGIPLRPYKFITHAPKLKTGIPARNGLARLAATAYMLKSFSIRDWMAFSEMFGMPVRLGRYGPSATSGDKDVLRRALANLGSDAAAMLPESMRIEFIERSHSTAGHTLFKELAEFIDKGISKVVLGQTGTTEGTPGKLGGSDEMDDVRSDIKRADAKQLARTLNRDFIKPFVDLNYGVQATYPRIIVFVPDEEDIAGLVEAMAKLVPLGLKVSQGVVRDKLGLPDPEEGAELLGAPAANPRPPAPPPQGERGMNRQRHHGGCQCAGCRGVALNQAEGGHDAVDGFVDDELSDWEPMMESVLDDLGISQLQALLPNMTEGEVRDEISRRVGRMGGLDALVNALALASFKARVDGYGEA